MPFKSKAQQRWMWWKHPDMAEEWQKKTPSGGKNLPEHTKASKSDNAAFDVHLTDPARLKKEVKKDFGLKARARERWACNECGSEYLQKESPKRCYRCGDWHFIKLD